MYKLKKYFISSFLNWRLVVLNIIVTITINTPLFGERLRTVSDPKESDSKEFSSVRSKVMCTNVIKIIIRFMNVGKLNYRDIGWEDLGVLKSYLFEIVNGRNGISDFLWFISVFCYVLPRVSASWCLVNHARCLGGPRGAKFIKHVVGQRDCLPATVKSWVSLVQVRCVAVAVPTIP